MGMVLSAPRRDKPRPAVFLPRRKCRMITKTRQITDLILIHRYASILVSRSMPDIQGQSAPRPKRSMEKKVMSTVSVGKPVPDFQLPATDNQTIRRAGRGGGGGGRGGEPGDN